MRMVAVGQEAVGFLAIGQLATGVIAIGQGALGVVAIGQLARGVIAVGQLSLGGVVFGQLAVGMLWSGGMLAVSPVMGPGLVGIPIIGELSLKDLLHGRITGLRLVGRPRGVGLGLRLAAISGVVAGTMFGTWIPLVDGLTKVFESAPRVLR